MGDREGRHGHLDGRDKKGLGRRHYGGLDLRSGWLWHHHRCRHADRGDLGGGGNRCEWHQHCGGGTPLKEGKQGFLRSFLRFEEHFVKSRRIFLHAGEQRQSLIDNGHAVMRGIWRHRLRHSDSLNSSNRHKRYWGRHRGEWHIVAVTGHLNGWQRWSRRAGLAVICPRQRDEHFWFRGRGVCRGIVFPGGEVDIDAQGGQVCQGDGQST